MNVECVRCGRQVECITVSDGTTYKPIAWTYPDAEHPLRGVCGSCQGDERMDDALKTLCPHLDIPVWPS